MTNLDFPVVVTLKADQVSALIGALTFITRNESSPTHLHEIQQILQQSILDAIWEHSLEVSGVNKLGEEHA